MVQFLDELEKPAEAYRGPFLPIFCTGVYNIHSYLIPVNLQDIRKGLSELKEGLKKIKSELDEHFSETDISDSFISEMWSFVAKATRRLEDLQDDVTMADTAFSKAVSYYGEEDRHMSSSEFYGIFKTFITSYKVNLISRRSFTQLTSFKFQEMSSRE